MKKAFTLVEVLMVIAILAVMSALLFPVLAQAKTGNKDRLSRTKAVTTTLNMYAVDSDEVAAPDRHFSKAADETEWSTTQGSGGLHFLEAERIYVPTSSSAYFFLPTCTGTKSGQALALYTYNSACTSTGVADCSDHSFTSAASSDWFGGVPTGGVSCGTQYVEFVHEYDQWWSGGVMVGLSDATVFSPGVSIDPAYSSPDKLSSGPYYGLCNKGLPAFTDSPSCVP